MTLQEEIEEAAERNANCYFSHPHKLGAPTPMGFLELKDSYTAGAHAFAIRALEMAADLAEKCEDDETYADIEIRKLADELRGGK